VKTATSTPYKLPSLMNPSPDLSEFTILIADDDPMNRLILDNCLKRIGFQRVVVDGGDEAHGIICSRQIDLVITDLRMKKGSGIELLRRLRRFHSDRFKKPAIIVVTGALKGGESYLKAFGVGDIFIKPLELSSVTQAVFRVLK